MEPVIVTRVPPPQLKLLLTPRPAFSVDTVARQKVATHVATFEIISACYSVYFPRHLTGLEFGDRKSLQLMQNRGLTGSAISENRLRAAEDVDSVIKELAALHRSRV